MHYSEEEQLYEMEKMMRGVLNFRPRKHGSIVPNGLDNPDEEEQLRINCSNLFADCGQHFMEPCKRLISWNKIPDSE